MCIGRNVNNALHLWHPPQAPETTRMLVCNNDSTIRMFNVPTMEELDSISFPAPMNYAQVSPDGSRFCAVGDNYVINVHRAREDGSWSHQPEMVLHEFKDAGMSCAWSRDGALIGAAGQDNRACLWDARSGALVAMYRTDSACRNIKFSQGPFVDLLAFSENERQVNLVDLRMLSRRQVLVVGGGSSEDGGVGGGLGNIGGGLRDPPAVRVGGRIVPGSNLVIHTPGHHQHRFHPQHTENITGLSFGANGTSLMAGSETGINAWQVDMVRRRTFAEGGLV